MELRDTNDVMGSVRAIHEAKAKLSALIAEVERLGEPVTICRYGRPVAELTPVRKGSRTIVDPQLSKVVITGDLTEPSAAEWEDA